jgi:DedD protein
MARSKELENDFDPRHRVVGAVILVTIAVIVLPLILDEHPTFEGVDSKHQEVAVATGAESTSRIVVKTIVNGQTKTESTTDDKKPGLAPAKAATESGQQATATRLPAADKLQNPVEEKKKSVEKPAPVVATRQTDTKEITTPHWAVQVGTFSNAGNVRRLSTQLKERGYSVMQKSVPLKQGSAVRVRVGPYSSRASADKAQIAINKQIGIKGVVVAGP